MIFPFQPRGGTRRSGVQRGSWLPEDHLDNPRRVIMRSIPMTSAKLVIRGSSSATLLFRVLDVADLLCQREDTRSDLIFSHSLIEWLTRFPRSILGAFV